MTAEEKVEHQRNLEQAKKEVREIKAMEAQLMWELEREEKREVAEADKYAEDEIMQWREDQSKGLQEIAEETKRRQRTEDLKSSKEYQTFKRDRKEVLKQDEQQYIKEKLQADLEFAHMQADMAKTAVADRHALVLESFEETQDLREKRAAEKLLADQVAKQERAHEQRLTYVHQAKQLSSEKEELLQNLQMLRMRQKQPVTSNRGLTSFGGRR